MSKEHETAVQESSRNIKVKTDPKESMENSSQDDHLVIVREVEGIRVILIIAVVNEVDWLFKFLYH